MVDFAGAMAARYAPALVFVLDVGEASAGLRVVETNGFNSASARPIAGWAMARPTLLLFCGVWPGSRMVVWGGMRVGVSLGDGAVYKPWSLPT